MFKKLSIICLLFAVLVGCSAHSTSDAEKHEGASTSSKIESSKNSVKNKFKTLYYHQLQKNDRDKIFFAFQAISDTSKAKSGQVANDTAPVPYNVDMQVKNNSKKIVKLDESKIVWLALGQSVDPTKSNKSKIITIMPGKTKNVVGLFSDFNDQNFVDAGAFCYLNSDYKLAYSYLAYKDGGVTSKNLNNKKLIAMNSAKNSTSQQDKASDNESDDNDTDADEDISVLKAEMQKR